MNWKKIVSIAIMAVVVLGALALIKFMPFWATVTTLVALIAGFIASWLWKDKIEEVIEIPEPEEILNQFKDWFASLTPNEASKAVSSANKAKKKATA